jgi:hypothetical protein
MRMDQAWCSLAQVYGTQRILLPSAGYVPLWHAISYTENEVSSQLRRFFSDCMDLFDGIRMKSIVISCWDDSIREAFTHAVLKLERSWRRGITFDL